MLLEDVLGCELQSDACFVTTGVDKPTLLDNAGTVPLVSGPCHTPSEGHSLALWHGKLLSVIDFILLVVEC